MVDFAAIVADEAELRQALAESDIVTLAMVLVQLTGDDAILDAVAPCVRGPWDYAVTMPDGLADEIRGRLVETLNDYAASGRALPPAPTAAQLQRMMSVSVGEAVSDEYAPMMAEELALDDTDPRGIEWRDKPGAETLGQFKTVIIGAGMSGILAAIRLQEAGIPFTLFEKNDTVGGTWYENDYPGCGVDTPNHFYSYSFEPSHIWTHFYSKRDKLFGYLAGCADKYGLGPHIRFETEVTAATYDEAAALWRVDVRAADGTVETHTANAVISAVGQLNRPQVPDIPGLDDFAGPVFHTARWDQDCVLDGKNVAMVGTGASGMQTGPAIAGGVGHLTIFQRTPHWVIANPNYHRSVALGKKWVLQHVPYYARWYRFQLFWGYSDGIHQALQVDPDWHMPDLSLNARNERFRQSMTKHLRRELGDDEALLAKVTPAYPPYGKRMLIDNHWFRMLKRDNVDLVTDPVAKVEADAIVTADGARHAADVIVMATGFQAQRMLWPMHIVGRDGVVLRDVWGDDNPKAYLGITMPSFPNFFVLYGPNTNLGHGGSAIFHAECQVRYVMKSLRNLMEGGHASMECRQEVHDDYVERCDDAHSRMVWAHPGMNNWYRNAEGRVISNSPWRLVDYWAMTAEPDFDDYIVA